MEQTVKIKDIGEYSIFVQEKIPIGTKALGIRRRDSYEWYIPTEIVKTEEGTVAYFNTRIDKIFKKGGVYPVMMLDILEYETFKWLGKSAILLEDLIKI